MGALVGIEYLDHFSDVRAAGVIGDGAQDLSCPYYIANWFGPGMAEAGHPVKFLRSNHATAELHLRDAASGGDDDTNADSVDLYLIITHGHYETETKQAFLLFDSPMNDWFSFSHDWRFGDGCNLEWLLIYGCHTVDIDHVGDHRHIFRRLHLMCGAYGSMWDSPTTDEVGADTAENLTSGMLVSDSWGEGVSDWYVANHPIVVSVERRETWNNGNVRWVDTVIGCDHVWGEGYTSQDIAPADQFWMAAQWWDGGLHG
jgi:Family of unknown function (DUF6345)